MREGEVVMKDFFRQKSAFRWILFVVFFLKLNIYHIYHIYTPWILETTQCMVYIYIPFFVCPLRTHVVYNIHVYIGIVSFLPLQWTCGCGLTHDSIFQVGPFTFGPLEDHPNGCKWLGSPLFISHGVRPFGKGNNPIFRELTITMVMNHLLHPGMILQAVTKLPVRPCQKHNSEEADIPVQPHSISERTCATRSASW